MIKRLTYFAFIAVLVGALTYFYIQVNHHSELDTEVDLIESLPNNPALIFEISKLKSLADNENYHSEMWNALGEISLFDTYAALWRKWDNLAQEDAQLSHWANNPAVLSYHLIGQKPQSFLAIRFKNKATEKAWKILLEAKAQKLEKEYNGVKIYHLDRDVAAYCFFYNSYFASSSSPLLLEQSIRHLQERNPRSEALMSLRKTKGSGADFNAFVNYDRLQQLLALRSSARSPLSNRLKALGDWGEFDYSVDQNKLIFNGFSSYQREDYWQIFAQQESLKMSIHEAIPASAKGFFCMTLSDLLQFRQDYETYLEHTGRYQTYLTWLKSVSQLGVNDLQLIFDDILDGEMALQFDSEQSAQSNESLLIMSTHSASSTLESMSNILRNYAQKKGSTMNRYRQGLKIDSETSYDVYQFPFKEAFSYLYGDAFEGFEANYFCIYDNYIFFATNTLSLKKAITANLRKQNIANDANFSDLYAGFSAKSSLFYFERTTNILPKLQKECGPEFCDNAGLKIDNLNNFYALAYQMVASDKYVYNSILLNYNANLKDKPLTLWNSQLEANPVGKPALVKNHYTNENEICVQDENYNLYLISNSGRIIWKKPIGEPILSEIKQIDYYRNNKLQLIFNTPSKIYVLDRNGNFVERYPILLPSEAATGMSVFDYDNNRNYRLFVPTVDKHIYLYTKEGNINKGFQFGTTEYPLKRPVQFFRVNHKDYLVFADKNHVYMLNRKGQVRVKLQEQFSASSQNDFYLGKDEQPFLATSDVNGQIKKVYFDGSVNTIALENIDDHHYFAMADLEQRGSNNYVIVNGDQINVYNFRGRVLYSKRFKEAELSRPYFYKFAANVTKIGLLNQSENEIYLLNGIDGDMYKDFPLVGSTPFSIGFLVTSAWRFNLIVGGEHASLYNYRVK